MKSTLIAIFSFLLVSTAAATVLPATLASIEGKVTAPQPIAGGVQIVAYPASATSLQGVSAYQIEAAAEGGLFRLSLPPGQYYLLARGGGWFTYYGRNPVTVPPAGLTNLNLPLVPTTLPTPEAAAGVLANLPEGGIAGLVLHDGKPVTGATVIVYTDLTSQLKGLGLGMAPPTDENGTFAAPLPAGTYYLVARLRRDHSFFGPLQAGDYFGYYPGNPVVVKPGEVVRLTLPLIEVPAKVEKLADSLFGQTSIRGRIVDGEGNPVAGVRALLYSDASMLNRPDHVSPPSDAEGQFILSFPEGGTYYLTARDSLGGAPSPGSLFGRYGGSPEASVRLKTGEALKDIRIVVQPMW